MIVLALRSPTYQSLRSRSASKSDRTQINPNAYNQVNLLRFQSMNSEELAAYIDATNGIAKPWLLAQLRLKKLQEQQPLISPEEYARSLADIHQDIMNLGEWWLGIEDQVF